MPEWVLTLFGVLFGGGVLLFADHVRHKRRKVERYRDIVVEKRITACSELVRMLTELYRHIDPIRLGTTALRWPPRGPGRPREIPEELQAQVKRATGHWEELTRFVADNQLLLGASVLKAWYVFYGAFGGLQIALNTTEENDAVVIDALMKLLHPSFDEISQAVQNEFPGADLDYLPSTERERLIKDGLRKGDTLLAKARDRLGVGSKAASEKGRPGSG